MLTQEFFRLGCQTRTKPLHPHSHWLTQKGKTTRSMAHIMKRAPSNGEYLPTKPQRISNQPKPMGCILSKPTTTTTAHPQSKPQTKSPASPHPCHLKSYSSSIGTLLSRKPSSNSLHHQKEEEDIEVKDSSESGTRFRDSQMEKYESAYKLLSSQSRRGRIEGILYHPSECTATRVDIVADQLWI